jgi:hypothetical protein
MKQVSLLPVTISSALRNMICRTLTHRELKSAVVVPACRLTSHSERRIETGGRYLKKERKILL